MTKNLHLALAVLLAAASLHTTNAQPHVYQTFSDLGNLSNQRIQETRDGGFLIQALEWCYTPGSIVIEGCIFGIHLVRLDNSGDTLWTRRLNFYTQYGPRFHTFEHDDGSFTLIHISNQNYSCEGILVGLSGFSQVELIRIDAQGLELGRTRFPDNCQLTLQNAIQVADKRFMLSATYTRPVFFPDTPEGRLLLIDESGNVLETKSFFGEALSGSKLLRYDDNVNLFLYRKSDGTVRLEQFDDQLTPTGSATLSGLDDVCFTHMIKLENGDLFLMCFKGNNTPDNTLLCRLTPAGNLLWKKTYTLNRASNPVEDANGDFRIATAVNNTGSGTDVALCRFDAGGDSVETLVFVRPAAESPEHIGYSSDQQLLITGNENCCNADIAVGPSKSFLLWGGILLSAESENISTAWTLYPNPAGAVLYLEAPAADFERARHWRLDLFDPLGQQVFRSAISAPSAALPLPPGAPGLYFYTITADGIPVQQGKLIRK